MNEDRTTEEERRYIMEARKRAMLKRKKLRTLGKSRDELENDLLCEIDPVFLTFDK